MSSTSNTTTTSLSSSTQSLSNSLTNLFSGFINFISNVVNSISNTINNISQPTAQLLAVILMALFISGIVGAVLEAINTRKELLKLVEGATE